MAFKYTKKQLQELDREQVIKLVAGLQENIERLTEENHKLKSVLEKHICQMSGLSRMEFKRIYRENQVFRR